MQEAIEKRNSETFKELTERKRLVLLDGEKNGGGRFFRVFHLSRYFGGVWFFFGITRSVYPVFLLYPLFSRSFCFSDFSFSFLFVTFLGFFGDISRSAYAPSSAPKEKRKIK